MAKNLLTENQASVETDTTGFSAAGSTISKDTTERYHRTSSLKVVTDGAAADEGAVVNNTDVSPSLMYTGSAYLKGSGTIILWIEERTAADVLVDSTSSSAITLSDTWTRYSISKTFGATGALARLYLLTNSAQAITFYNDALQLEHASSASDWRLPSEGSASPSASPSPAPARIPRFMSSVPPIF